MENVCEKCGDKGYLKDLIFCVLCKVSAEHRYCSEIVLKGRNRNVVWTCEECTASPRRRKRISQAAEVRLIRKRKIKQLTSSGNKARDHVHTLTGKAKQPTVDCLVSNDEELKRVSFSDKNVDNEEQKKQRRLILEYGDDSDD